MAQEVYGLLFTTGTKRDIFFEERRPQGLGWGFKKSGGSQYGNQGGVCRVYQRVGFFVTPLGEKINSSGAGGFF